MGVRITRIINDELIDIREFAKPNACFRTNEYPDSYDFCILHEQFNPYDLINDNKIKDKEIARLNKIIDELEKWLEERLDKLDLICDDEIYSGIEYALNKLKELKEEGKKDE